MLEHLAYIIFSGFIVGVFISAPMGPIGMLVIQRTLSKGRTAALYTGVGAALSDLLYCLLSGLGLSLVTDFIESNKAILQIVGSLVLIIYGIYLFRNNPTQSIPRTSESPTNYWRDFATGFLFTFSNPLILFFIIGLFARFNFMDSNYVYYHYIAGYLAIIAGALTWWFLITYFVDKVRGRFNMRTLWVLNRAIAGVLIGMALIGTVHAIQNLLP